MDYDDGFVAYLNGTEIARGNPTGSTWRGIRRRLIDAGAAHFGRTVLWHAYEAAVDALHAVWVRRRH